MDRYGASSRHYDFDSASDTGRDYSPRSGGPPRNSGRPLRGHPAHRGPTLGRGAHPNLYASDEDSDFEPHSPHHHYHHGRAGGACCADLYRSDDDSEFEACCHHHGHAGGTTRDEPRIVIRANGAAHSGPNHFCGNYSSSSSSDDESGYEHHAAARGGPAGAHRRRPEMRFDTDSSDDSRAHLAHHHISHGPGGRRSTAAYPPRSRAPLHDSTDESELERHMASSRRGRGATGAPRGGMMAPLPPHPRNGRATVDRRGAVSGGRP